MNVNPNLENVADPLGKMGHPTQTETMYMLADRKKQWNECMVQGFYRVGLPFAFGCHLLSKYWKPYQVVPLPFANAAKSVLIFSFNCLFGMTLYSPYCHAKVNQKIIEERRKMMREGGGTPGLEEVGTPADLTNYASMDSNMSSEDFSNFDMNFDFPMSDNDGLILEDVEEKSELKMPKTSYQDLRKQNRQSFYNTLMNREKQQQESAASKIQWERQRQNVYPGVSENKFSTSEPPRNIGKNKYGDEMES